MPDPADRPGRRTVRGHHDRRGQPAHDRGQAAVTAHAGRPLIPVGERRRHPAAGTSGWRWPGAASWPWSRRCSAGGTTAATVTTGASIGPPAGAAPASGEAVAEVPDPGAQVPVALAPPSLPLVEAGAVARRPANRGTPPPPWSDWRSTVPFGCAAGDHPQARLVDSRKARDRPSVVLLEELFDGGVTAAALNSPDCSPAEGITASWPWRGSARTRRLVHSSQPRTLGRNQRDRRWRWATSPFSFLAPWRGIAPVLVVGAHPCRRAGTSWRRGQRTGPGRALTDQVEGLPWPPGHRRGR